MLNSVSTVSAVEIEDAIGISDNPPSYFDSLNPSRLQPSQHRQHDNQQHNNGDQQSEQQSNTSVVFNSTETRWAIESL